MSASKVDWEDGKITDEGLAYMHAELGIRERVPAWNSVVSQDSIWHFALGVGDDNPLWWDDGYAQQTRWRGLIAPPTYLFSHANGPRLTPAQGKSMAERFLPGVLGLWASEKWRWRRPVRPGERIHAEAWLDHFKVSDNSSFGGRSVAQTERQDFVDDKGDIIVEVTRTLKRFERSQTRARTTLLERPLAHYDEADRRRFAEQYEREVGDRRGAKPLYASEVAVGDGIGPMLKGPLVLGNIVGFLCGAGNNLGATNRMHQRHLNLHPGVAMIHPESGVADNYQISHFDPLIARAGGMPTGYDFGIQRFSWLAHLVTDWAGDDGFLEEMDFRLLRPNFFNDVTWLSGEVFAVDPSMGRITLTLKATNQLDETTATATAIVLLPTKN